MRDGLTFLVNWTDTQTSLTAAKIKIDVAGNNACRAENHWSRSVDDAPHLDAMPLALWLAGSWWRLRWEGKPLDDTGLLSWRMAHEVAAAGEGFLWPRLTFVSDGEVIQAECRPSDPQSREIFRYISNFDAAISASAFEAGIDRFLALVLERTDGSNRPPLVDLWKEVLEERSDPEMAFFRRLEATVGFDADEAPEQLMEMLMELRNGTGEEAAAEIAAVCSGSAPADKLREIMEFDRNQRGVTGRLDESIRELPVGRAASAPEHGRLLARSLRRSAGIAPDAVVSDSELGNFLGLTEEQLTQSVRAEKKPVALMISDDQGLNRFLFRSRRTTGRRFEAARLLCDGLARGGDRWHPATDTDTARQKMQRSFAAEFLVPVDGLLKYIDGDFSMDAIEGAAEYFDVSSYAAASQLANNGHIQRSHPAVRMLLA